LTHVEIRQNRKIHKLSVGVAGQPVQGGHTPVAVRRPLGADRLDLLDKPSFADGL
jgi:hypothetical protein